MGKRDILIEKYAEDLRRTFGIEPDPGLLERVTLNCGPLIYDPASECLDPDDAVEMTRLRENFLVRKLSLDDEPGLDDAIGAVLDVYDKAGGPIHRAVVHYMLVLQFEKEHLFA
jgi:hypothetical protein